MEKNRRISFLEPHRSEYEIERDQMEKILSQKKIVKHNNFCPVKRDVIQKIVHFNTKYRDNFYNTSSSDFKYNFPLPVNNVVSMRLRSLDIPNTWYTFSENRGNSKFIIEVKTRRTDLQIFEIIIPDGNYNAVQLCNYLNNTYLYQSGITNNLNYIKINVSEINLKTQFQIVRKPPIGFKFNLKFITTANKPLIYSTGWLLGFRSAEYINISQDIESEGLFDAGGDRYIYISLEDFNKSRNDNNIIFLDKTYIDKDIIGKMYLHDGKFNVNISDNDAESNVKKRVFMGPVDIKTIKIKLLDEYGNNVHLNNMDWSFSLEFDILYKKNINNYSR